MNAAMLLSRLDGVRKAKEGWRANCPNGHAKSRGSLAIGEADDGRILLNCFNCHDTPAILGALGLELADLYPERIRDPSPEARQRAREAFKRSSWAAALGVLGREAGVVLLAARDMMGGAVLSADDMARLTLAEGRIQRAREVLA